MDPKGWSKSDKNKSITETFKKVQVEKMCQDTIDFTSTTKKPKQEESTLVKVVNVENKHDNQVAVKRDFFT